MLQHVSVTEDPSSGNCLQCLDKIIKMALSCPLTWTWSVLWQYNETLCACVQFTVPPYTPNYTQAHRVRLYCHNTDHVDIKGYEGAITVIFTKYCTKLPDGGSSVIRNMSEHF